MLRIAMGPRGRLRAEIIPDFRPWLVDRVKSLRKAATYLPDDGGLNVEAVSWDPRTGSLLVGLRTPLQAGLRGHPHRVGLISCESGSRPARQDSSVFTNG